MIKKIFIGLSLTFFSTSGMPQFFDFENDDLLHWTQNNPERWTISDEYALNGHYSLKHVFNNDNPGNDIISLPIGRLNIKDTLIWEFSIRHGYHPSSMNNWAIFLISDIDPVISAKNACKNAYLLSVNYSSSDDVIKLLEINDNDITELVNTNIDWEKYVGTENFVRFKIKLVHGNQWFINLRRNMDGHSMQFTGNTTKRPVISGYYFGISYQYSSSQDQKLWLDDIYLPVNVKNDRSPPNVKSIKVLSDSSLILTYNEPIVFRKLNKNNMRINEMQSVDSICLLDSSTVYVYSSKKLNTGINTAYFHSLTDLYGNESTNLTVEFEYYIPKPFDIVIVEIMADPLPSAGLPEKEYIELFNRTEKILDIGEWILNIGGHIRILKECEIKPREYIILCDYDDLADFQPFGHVVPVQNFPALKNSGAYIMLKDKNNNHIHTTSYSNNWYDLNYKSQGGWSLEMIDADFPCVMENNWQESQDPLGGTPGKKNSVSKFNPDIDNPRITRAYPEGDSIIYVLFSELMQPELLHESNNYHINHNIGYPKNVKIMWPDHSSVKLILDKKLRPGKTYIVDISSLITDCNDNSPDNSFIHVALPEKTDVNDIVFNEILFNSGIEKYDFIEIYNRSEKIVNVNELLLANREGYKHNFDPIIPLQNKPYIIFPGDYILISENIKSIRRFFYIPEYVNHIKVDRLPHLGTKNGHIVLLNKSLQIIDELKYDENMHFPLLTDLKGISLERINPDMPSHKTMNWHSAASNAGWATPGYQNSQFMKHDLSPTTNIEIIPEIFTPNNDGYHDMAEIHYSFSKPGNVANVKIYDSKGRLIRWLYQNELLGTEGALFWDGRTQQGIRAQVGMYIIYIQIFDLNGNLEHFKKSSVLGAKLH